MVSNWIHRHLSGLCRVLINYQVSTGCNIEVLVFALINFITASYHKLKTDHIGLPPLLSHPPHVSENRNGDFVIGQRDPYPDHCIFTKVSPLSEYLHASVAYIEDHSLDCITARSVAESTQSHIAHRADIRDPRLLPLLFCRSTHFDLSPAALGTVIPSL